MLPEKQAEDGEWCLHVAFSLCFLGEGRKKLSLAQVWGTVSSVLHGGIVILMEGHLILNSSASQLSADF